MSQRRLGELIGVSGTAVQAWESGRSIPDRARVHAIVIALGLDRGEWALLEQAAQTDEITRSGAPAA